ncbi:MAG TPA: flagellar biosynthesis protein FlgN [Spirochaetales bacterium]|nr:flagellar biosynthesis protein FlgN [Spirochaetales bacterium]HRY55579.1 flagellar biosynthesis protein FlgN [Spirochaetia bacterium]
MTATRDGELEQRVALLRRFRELLVEQRGKFERYLAVLDHERADIESGDVDRLVAHVEIEEQVVSEIYTFQKAIDPLDELYRSAFAASPGARDADRAEVPALKAALEELKAEVIRRNGENRVLLGTRMALLRGEIAAFRNPAASRRSVYAGAGEGGIVDISG